MQTSCPFVVSVHQLGHQAPSYRRGNWQTIWFFIIVVRPMFIMPTFAYNKSPCNIFRINGFDSWFWHFELCFIVCQQKLYWIVRKKRPKIHVHKNLLMPKQREIISCGPAQILGIPLVCIGCPYHHFTEPIGTPCQEAQYFSTPENQIVADVDVLVSQHRHHDGVWCSD